MGDSEEKGHVVISRSVSLASEVFEAENSKSNAASSRDMEKKLELEKVSDSLIKENNASADKIFSLLTEKFELITECDSLGASVKDLKIFV